MTVFTIEKEWNTIVSLKGDDDREKFLMGVAYNNIVDNQLAQQAGYKSASELIAAKLKEAAQAPPTVEGLKVRELSVSTVKAYGTVSRTFSADDFVTYGYSNLQLLLRYQKAGALDTIVPPSQAAVRVPDASGELREKPFAECSASELRAALRALRPAAEELPAAVEDTLELLNLAVDTVVGVETRCDVDAKVKDGRVFVTLDAAPLDQLEEILWTMLEALPRD